MHTNKKHWNGYKESRYGNRSKTGAFVKILQCPEMAIYTCLCISSYMFIHISSYIMFIHISLYIMFIYISLYGTLLTFNNLS